MKTLNKLALTAVVAVGMVFSASALTITPSSTPRWQGSLPKNPDAEDIENITGTSAELTLAYKDDQGGSEGGSFSGSYNTTYDPPNDPLNATLTYVSGQPVITGTPIFLALKDGNHDPRWYIFDISTWNGTETINMNGFWPGGGAISHISIYTGEGGTQVPDAGSTLALLGLALTSVGFLRRKLA